MGRLLSLVALFVSCCAQDFEFPFSDNCALGNGFDMKEGCKASALSTNVPACKGAPTGVACILQDKAEGDMVSYLKDVRSSDDQQSLASTMVSAEGGGWGVHISAGFKSLQQSQMSANSIAFNIGASGLVRKDYYRNEAALKLTANAADFLRRDPKGFAEQNGLYYVYKVIYGGSYSGSFSLYEDSGSTKSDLDVFASFSVQSGFFSAGGSVNYEKAVSSSSSHLKKESAQKYSGGKDVPLIKDGSPQNMSDSFSKWSESFREYPWPLTIVVKKWNTLQDVQAIIDKQSAEIRALFDPKDITSTTGLRISQENAKIMFGQASVDQALAWEEAKSNWTLQQELNTLKHTIDAHAEELNTLDQAGLEMVQANIEKGNSSWFVMDSLMHQYNMAVANIKPKDPSWWGIKTDPRADHINVGYVYRSTVKTISGNEPEKMTSDQYRSIAFGNDGRFYGVGEDMKIWRCPISKIRNSQDGWEQVGTSDHNVFISIHGDTVWAGWDTSKSKSWYDKTRDPHGVEYGGALWQVALSDVMDDAKWKKVRTDAWRSVAVSPDGFFYGVGQNAKLWRVKLENLQGEAGWEKLNDNNWWWQVFIDHFGEVWAIGENSILYKTSLANAGGDAGWETVRNDKWNSLAVTDLSATHSAFPTIVI